MHTEWLEGTFSVWAGFWEARRENTNFCVKEGLTIAIPLLPETLSAALLQLQAMMTFLRHLLLGECLEALIAFSGN